MPPTLREELAFLYMLLDEQLGIWWESLMGHLIKKVETFVAWGDACLCGGGCFSINLDFTWHLTWPEAVFRRTIIFIKSNKKREAH